MRRSIIFWVLGGVLVVGGGALAYLYFAGGSGEPSTELTTPSVAAGPTTSTEEPSRTSATSEPAGVRAFVIDPVQSVATFEIDEVLRGEPKRVVGTTSELAGQVRVDPGDLSTIQFSQILVNARTFETDSGNRDRAIRGPVVLNSASDDFELITFDATSVEGLDGSLTSDDLLTFTVTGDLLIRGTANPVTFEVTATLVEATLEGTAEATVLRSDFGIGIPSAPGVADVGEDVVIRLDFVASS